MTEFEWQSDNSPEKAILVGLHVGRGSMRDTEESLDELERLADSAGAEIVDGVLVRRPAPDPGTYIGKGKVQEIAERAAELGANLVIFDDDLAPVQGRNLEKALTIRVIDRTQMILDIFAQHARTKEGCLQIELAQLEYTLPRLRRMWTHLERQKGGIGLRGPGEQQIEVDRRKIQQKITRIKREIEQVRKRRAEQRRGRRRHGWALASFVGYTNAGKSTLFNALTGAKVEAYDKLFATLDPTTRQIKLPNNQQALISDTVGFIRKLPHHLVDSFKATLEEVIEADLLVHVMDGAHEQFDEQVKAVDQVLHDLGVIGKPTIKVVNKIDKEAARKMWQRLERSQHDIVGVSAKTGEGLDTLLDVIADRFRERNVTVDLLIPAGEGKALALLRQAGHLLSEEYVDSHVRIKATVPYRSRNLWEQYEVGNNGEME